MQLAVKVCWWHCNLKRYLSTSTDFITTCTALLWYISSFSCHGVLGACKKSHQRILKWVVFWLFYFGWSCKYKTWSTYEHVSVIWRCITNNLWCVYLCVSLENQSGKLVYASSSSVQQKIWEEICVLSGHSEARSSYETKLFITIHHATVSHGSAVWKSEQCATTCNNTYPLDLPVSSVISLSILQKLKQGV